MLQNPRNRHEKLWKIFTNFVIKCKKIAESRARGVWPTRPRHDGGNKKKEKGKIGIHAPIGFAVVCSLQIAFKLILFIDRSKNI